MNIYKRELIRNSKSTIMWTSILLVYNASMLLLFPTMQGALKDKMDIMLQTFPKGVLAAFGMDKTSLVEILGFYNTYCYLLVTILGGIFAILQGISVLSKEEDEKTVEFLLSKPISRSKVITEKILAVFTNIIILNVIVSLVSYILIQMVNKESYDKKALLLLFIGPVLMQITYAAIGLLLSVFIIKARVNSPTGVGIVLGTYFISIITAITDKVSFLKYFTPFKYVDGANIITNQTIEPIYIILMAAIIFVCTFATYLIYNKKDIIA